MLCGVDSFDEANSFYELSLPAMLRKDPLEATSVYLKQAKCLMYLGRSADAASYAKLAVKQKKDLGENDSEMAVSLDVVASILIGCQRVSDVKVAEISQL